MTDQYWDRPRAEKPRGRFGEALDIALILGAVLLAALVRVRRAPRRTTMSLTRSPVMSQPNPRSLARDGGAFFIGLLAVIVPGAAVALFLATAPTSSVTTVLLILIATAAGMLLWLTPIFVARRRGVPNQGSIIVITLLLGLTVIGWAVALAMAMRDVPAGRD